MKGTKKKIAILGPIGNSIPPKKQGGIEWMVYYLTENLVKKGYRVLLFAPSDTRTSAELVSISSKPVIKYKVLPKYERARKLRIELSILANILGEILKRKDEIGVIFNHTVSGGMFAHLEKMLNIPTFHILHLPLFEELAIVFKKYNARLIPISGNQKKAFPVLNYQATIYNGINLKKIPFSKKPGGYLIWSAKIMAYKNPLDAIKAAKSAREKIILIGRINDQKYFETKIKPLLNKNIIYLGEVSFSKAIKLYRNAKSLLFPIKWEEPFGLVMIEAMACGTPVIAYPNGAVPEVIKDKKTGFIVKNVKEMAEAIKNIDKINRKKCRERVEKYFSVEKMVDNYQKLIKKFI
ncbi:MAG: glycosyltransferase family 4 protein [Candidatus Pacebacteria bacterium]|nr:glycosyltransferase family 4 protein [Candidatus Paceibacterota bacterium]